MQFQVMHFSKLVCDASINCHSSQ